MSETRLTEDMLRIYEGLKKEQKLGFIIESLIHSREKPYRSEVEEDGKLQAQRQEEFKN